MASLIERLLSILNESEKEQLKTLLHGYVPKEKKEKQSVFDFEEIYKNYPRKMGKARGLKILSRIIKNQLQYDRFKASAKNYALYCKKENIAPQFIMHFSTFVSNYEDWVTSPTTAIGDDFNLSPTWLAD